MTTDILQHHAIVEHDAALPNVDAPTIIAAAAILLLLPMAEVVMAFLK